MLLQHRNRLDNRGCKEMDEVATELFLREVKDRGWTSLRATRKQDTQEHWDWKITKGDRTFLVDIKGRKRIDSTGEPDDRLICIEYTNVDGNIGWLRGKSDYIAFSIREGFAFVPTPKLLEYSKTVINWNGPVIPSPQGKVKHTVYQRSQWGRSDLVAYLTKQEILKLATTVWSTKCYIKTDSTQT